ncbi:MAG: hypothetical protein O9266_14785 [Porphyrobacter sp.]|nr:hypothetical protein [Porphyrobacter sp.]
MTQLAEPVAPQPSASTAMEGAFSGRALVIKAKGGLGNRMLSAITGLVLARLNDRTPFIDWRDGMYVERGVNLYPLLFDAGWMGDVDQFDAATVTAPALWADRMADHPTDIIHQHFPNQHQDPFLYRKLGIPMNGPDPAERVGVFWSYLPKLKRLAGRMARHPAFAGKGIDAVTSDYLASYFRPVPEVAAKVDAIFRDIAAPVIGVHIRFTDRKAPLPRIIATIEKLARAHPEARIFLATDSAEAEEAVLARFPDVLRIDKALAQGGQALHVASGEFADPVEEARNALVDMMALARCNWLVHSSHSTFSVTAALIGRIPRERQADVDRFNPKVRIKQAFQARA